MAESDKFNELASSLTVQEREGLLKKLAVQSNISKESLYEEGTAEPPNTIEVQYQRLPWYYHVWLLLLSFFKSKSPVKVFEDNIVNKIGQEIEAKYPGYFSYKQNLLLPLFHKDLMELRESVRFFKDTLELSIQRGMGEFYAFLGSLEMPDIHKRLTEETLPLNLSAKHPGANHAALKQMALGVMEDAFAGINEDHRNAMYQNAHSLLCLKELSFFLFDRVLYAFSTDSAVSGMSCSASVVREQLASLNNILFSLRNPPGIELLSSLFVFVLQERAGEAGFDIDEESKELLAKADNSLITVREFNKSIPLTLILRFANREAALTPVELVGGGDWFTIYRDYWKQHIENVCGEFEKTRRQQELLESFRRFLKGASLRTLEHSQSEANPKGLPIRKEYDLSFLLTFHAAVFVADINKVLRPILIEGEFSKREYRTMFTESFNDLMKLDDDIKRFDSEIAPTGEIGKQYAIAQADMSLTSRRRRSQSVIEAANDSANFIISRARTAVKNMLTVLQGVAKKDPDGKNEMLVNIAKFIGKPPTVVSSTISSTPVVPLAFTPKGLAFFNSINEVIKSLQETVKIMDNIDALGLDAGVAADSKSSP
ncbi:MAG: DUF5312 domain-containing protein [Treponema sp.]|jgi:hypothetical protein|nr:DUF5312 domain-containing protein [Treponema sp.]